MCPKLPALAFCMHPEDGYAVRANGAGAPGYLTKRSTLKAVVAALRSVAAGGRYVSPSPAERLT